MKSKLLAILTALILLSFPKFNYGQAPTLGTLEDYALFTSVGAVTNAGIPYLTRITGNVGTNSDPTMPGFGNINGLMTFAASINSTQAAADLLIAYNNLDTATPTFFPANLLGNGQVLTPGVYSIASATTLSGQLILDAEGAFDAVFIIQIEGPLSTDVNSEVVLINGAEACNVFWKVEGLVDMAPGTIMKGTVIANNAAINMTAVELEGRALSTTGAISVGGVLVQIPIGCGSPVLHGPMAPNLGSTACYALFTSVGALSNAGVTNVTGDVGTNVGLTVGYDPLLVTGTIHPIPDASTAAAANDLLVAYNDLTALAPGDIELFRPDLFGHDLILTPHTYTMLSAVTFTGSVYLDAQGNPNAIFVILVNGAFSAGVNSQVILINGAQAKNVYWKIDGAVTINDNSIFNGTIVNDGAVTLNTGVSLNGRVLSIDGAVATTAIDIHIPPGTCDSLSDPLIVSQPISDTVCVGDSVSFSVVASGTGLTYQWRIGNVDLVDGGNISGSTTSTLTIYPASLADTAFNYNVVVDDISLPSEISIHVSLTVNPITTITTEPVNKAVCLGDPVSFSVVAEGADLTYQWRKGNVNLVDGGNISGATTDILTIDPVSLADVANDYNVIVSGLCGSDTSINVSLNIGSGSLITTEPTNQIACTGNPVSFSVIASGVGVTYQWRNGIIDIIDGGNISGATTATLTIDPATIADVSNDYNVIVTGTCGNDTSINVSLSMGVASIITTEPTDEIVCAGDPVSFSIIASGSGLTYQWRNGVDNLVNGGNISGATSSTLTINPVAIEDTSSDYYVIISGVCGNDTSIQVSLNIEGPIIITEPTNQEACSGDQVNFSVVAYGTGLTYQWRVGNVNLVNGGNISGATSANLTIDPATLADVANNYNVVVSGVCGSVTSVNASLHIGGPIITTEPTNQIVCAGSSASFSVTTAGAGITYQWRAGTVDLVNGGNISGATSSTLTINNVSSADTVNTYNVVVIGACAPNDTSISVSLSINPPTGATTFTAGATTVCQNAVNETYTATSTNNTSITYSVLPVGAGIINGNTGIMNWNSGFSGTATITATSHGLCNTTTANRVVTVNPLIGIITFTDGPITACQNATDTYTATSSNGTSIIYSVLPLTAGTINANTGAITWDAAFLGAATITATSNGLCDTASANRVVTVNASPVAVANSNSPICIGSAINLTAQTATGATYQWTGPNSYSSSDQNPTILSASSANAGNYTLTLSLGACSSVSTIGVLVKDCEVNLSVVKTVNNTTPIIGNNVVFTIVATNNGPADATGVEVLDMLRSGYVYVSSTVTTGTYNTSTGVWTIGNLSNGATATLTITATVVREGDHVNTATIEGDETDDDLTNNTSTIEVFPTDLFIPEGVSPNGDGINDFLVIRGISNYPSNSFLIFNRWGQKVFEESPYQNKWEGKNESKLKVGGDRLPTGTYFYLLDLGDGSEVIKGNIYLNP